MEEKDLSQPTESIQPANQHSGFLVPNKTLKEKLFPSDNKFLLIPAILLVIGIFGIGGFFLEKKLSGKMLTPSISSLVPSLSDKGAPTITNSINGLKYTSSEAKEWQSRRPMAVMIDNHAEARPQKGLSQADLIYEAVAEGGITRFLAVFHSKLPEVVGPVRSARVYYVDWAKEYDAWYTHWGQAQTNNEANAFARMQSIFVSSIESANACSYDETSDRAIEHTLYCKMGKLYEEGYTLYPDQPKEYKPLTAWEFKDEKIPAGTTDAATTISFNFWDLPEYAVGWRYNEAFNNYERYQNSEIQKDALNNQTLTASNLIVSFMSERELNDEKLHLIYDDISTGNALVFLDGRVIQAEWKRLAYSDRTVFTDVLTGKEIKFNRGQVWIEVVPGSNKESVVYQ